MKKINLRPAEIMIIQSLANGITGKATAADIKQNYGAFNTTLGRIRKKCGVKNMAELIAYGFRKRLIK